MNGSFDHGHEAGSLSSTPFVSSLEDGFVDFYEILGVNKTASLQEIRSAYFQLKSTYSHQNQALYAFMSDADASHMLSQIEEAYQVLLHEQKRKDHHKKLIERGLLEASHSQVEVAYEKRALTEEKRVPSSEKFCEVAATEKDSKGMIKQISDFFKKPGASAKSQAQSASAVNQHIASMGDQLKETMGDGQFLKELRTKARISLEQMQEHIKVSADTISHIEENRFERLPQPVYVKGFLKSYCRFLGIGSADPLIDAYMARFRECSTTDN